ncbi:MAG: helix-turn-helix transcriptional regulator [Candidatus Sedimenticola sp. 20ELBAFRAG]
MNAIERKISVLLKSLYPTALNTDSIAEKLNLQSNAALQGCDRLHENGYLEKTKDGKHRWINENTDTLSHRLRFLRSELGITQKQLGDMCFESQSVIHKIENGQILRPRAIEAIADALNVNPAWLQFGERWALRSRSPKNIILKLREDLIETDIS